MRTLMLGWEFPPIYSGGLGVVSKKLATELAVLGEDVLFAVPHFVRESIEKKDIPDDFEMADFSRPQFAERFLVRKIVAGFQSPYITEEGYEENITTNKIFGQNIPQKTGKKGAVYGQNLWEEIDRFAAQVEILAQEETNKKPIDLIHAHDWITFEAGIRAKLKLNVPLICHVHSTEMDRTGGSPNQEVFNREKYALEFCDRILAVSDFTKEILVNDYGIPREKIQIIHNALRTKKQNGVLQKHFGDKHKFTVLFVGRMTLQKGPDYFFQVAKKVCSKTKKINFIFAGNGDMLPRILKKITRHKLQKNVFCLGFLGPDEKRKAYESADVVIVPSVAEPFGLIGLEAVEYGVPVILTKNSGVKEVVQNSLKSDFWDVPKMANYVMATEKYPVLRKVLTEKAYAETRKLNWENQAYEIAQIYKSVKK